MPVTWRNALENAATLEKPSSVETRDTGVPTASRSMACTILARWRQALKVKPVSEGKSRLSVRIDVAARHDDFDLHASLKRRD